MGKELLVQGRDSRNSLPTNTHKSTILSDCHTCILTYRDKFDLTVSTGKDIRPPNQAYMTLITHTDVEESSWTSFWEVDAAAWITLTQQFFARRAESGRGGKSATYWKGPQTFLDVCTRVVKTEFMQLILVVFTPLPSWTGMLHLCSFPFSH